MKTHIALSVKGSSREAMEFYAGIFRVGFHATTYGEIPGDPGNPIQEADKNKVAWGTMEVGGLKIHFGDKLSGPAYVPSENVVLHLSLEGAEEAARVFHGLKAGGEVLEDLHEEFFADVYGKVADKFGVVWNVLGLGPIAYRDATG